MTDTLRDKLIQKGWVTPFNADTLVHLIEEHYADEPAVPAPPADVSQLSDGYHTFADLYEHRHSLMLALMRALSGICWFSRRHADGELPFGSDDWFIVGAELPGAPITYHLPADLYPLAQKTGALELPTGRPWDGHSAADVVQRLRDWAIAPAPPADGEVAELVAWLQEEADDYACIGCEDSAARCNRTAELLQRQVLVPVLPDDALIIEPAEHTLLVPVAQPVPVCERLPGAEDCDAEGRCWWFLPSRQFKFLDQCARWSLMMHSPSQDDRCRRTHWLPAHALPLPEVNND